MKKTKANNYGNGFWMTFADGYYCWMLGASRTEIKIMENQHGKLLKKVPA